LRNKRKKAIAKQPMTMADHESKCLSSAWRIWGVTKWLRYGSWLKVRIL